MSDAQNCSSDIRITSNVDVPAPSTRIQTYDKEMAGNVEKHGQEEHVQLTTVEREQKQTIQTTLASR